MRKARALRRFAGVVGLAASLIALVGFVTGKFTLSDVLRGVGVLSSPNLGQQQAPTIAPATAMPQTESSTPQAESFPAQTESPTPANAYVPHPTPEPVTQVPSGSFLVNRRVTVFGSGFYGRHAPLWLQSVENHPGSRLVLRFLIENEGDADYSFALSNPEETAVAIDESRGYYSFLSSEGIESSNLVTVPAGGRRSFSVAFQPLTAPRRSLTARLTFVQQRDTSVGFSVQGQGAATAVRVDIPNIQVSQLGG